MKVWLMGCGDSSKALLALYSLKFSSPFCLGLWFIYIHPHAVLRLFSLVIFVKRKVTPHLPLRELLWTEPQSSIVPPFSPSPATTLLYPFPSGPTPLILKV